MAFYITQKNWDKILGYAEEAYKTYKSEIGGMSVMIKDKDGDWKMEDPVILKQEISSGNTILEKDALAEYYTRKARKMGTKDFRFCWWHSHHTMSAFWSGTDIKAIQEFDEGDFSFALVVNLKGEYKFRVSVWNPVEAHEDVELEILKPNKLNKRIVKEVEQLCSKEVSVTNGWGYNQNVYKRNQATLWNSNLSLKDDNQLSHTDIIDLIENLTDKVVDGTINYQSYKNKVDTVNKALEDQKSHYRVKLVEEVDIDSLLHVYPYQLIEYEHEIQESFYGHVY